MLNKAFRINTNHICIFTLIVFTFLQYRFRNITNLGLISDDWDWIRAVTFSTDHSLKSYVDFFWNTSGVGILFRPYWITLLPLQMYIFANNVHMYHIFSASLVALSSVILFLCTKKLTLSPLVAFSTSLLFISWPNHTEGLYWLSAQMSVFAVLFVLLSWYSMLSHNWFVKYVLTSICFFLGLVNYESSIAFFAFIILLVIFEKNDLGEGLKKLLPFVFSIILFFVYRTIFLKYYLHLNFPKTVDLNHNLSSTVKSTSMLHSNYFGPQLYAYIQSILQDRSTLIYILTDWTLLIGYVIVLVGIYLAYKKCPDTQHKNLISIQVSSFIFYLTSLVLLVLIGYTNIIGYMGDRVNLLSGVGMALFLSVTLYSLFKHSYIMIITFIITINTILNLSRQQAFINAYRAQIAFTNYAAKSNLTENTLITLDTDISQMNNVSVLNTVWGISYLLSNRLYIKHIEYIGTKNDRARDIIDQYDSGLYINFIRPYSSVAYLPYKYIKPRIVHLHFNKEDIPRWLSYPTNYE